MTKFQLLLLALTVAILITACSLDSGQETAVRPAADQVQDAPMVENQEPTNIAGEEAAPTEMPPTEPPSPTGKPALAPLPVIAPAPGWQNDTWINTDTALPLEDLRGKVVLLEFWTFG